MKLYLINTIPTTTRMMMMMTNSATITPKIVARLPLAGGGSVVPPVCLSGDVAGDVGLVMGGCVTTAPVKESSKVLLGHCLARPNQSSFFQTFFLPTMTKQASLIIKKVN